MKAKGLQIRLESGNQGKSRLTGVVNDGQSLLRLRTSGGDIQIDQT